jgi:outer membrane receptor protein involved in Fe transport
MLAGGEPVSRPPIDSEQAGAAAGLLACCALGCVFAAWAHPVRADTTLSVDIPSQSVAGALAEFARQTGLQFIYVSKIVKARASKGAHAGLTPAEALPVLLDGTGLGFEFLNGRTVRIFESAPAAPAVQPIVNEAPKAPVRRHTPWFGGLDEIVVTGARDRDALSSVEDVQNVAASVSVVSGSTLEAQKFEQLSDYAAYLPGVNVASYGSPGNSQVLLRGVSSFTEAATGGYYLDDTPMGASGPWASACCYILDLMPYDLDRLELLRGPQGTRYGADSESGLIRFVLKEPSVSAFEAHVGADTGAINGASSAAASLRFMVNAPIVRDMLAVRVSAYDSYTPGYIDNAYSGAKDVNAVRQSGERISLLWRPAASVSVKVTALWPRIHSDSEADVSSNGVAIVADAGDAYIVKASASYGDLTDHHAFLQPFSKSIDYYAATVHWNPGSLEVVSATAWSRTQTHSVFDQTLINGANFPQGSGGPPALSVFHRDINLEKFSEELHVASPRGRRVEWLLGGFYTHESVSDLRALYAFDTSYQPIAAFAPVASATAVLNTFSESAAFGELTWHVTGQIDLTGGIRYAHNDQQFTATDSGVVDEPAYTAGRSAEGVTTWMTSASYRFTPDVMLYGRVATGSQPGSSNGIGVPPVNAETVTNYEMGLKSEFLDRMALMDLSVFYMDWKDIQLGMCFDGGGCGYGSGADAVSRGLELSGSYTPLPGLTFGCNAAYTQSELTTVVPAAGSLLAGYQLADVPKWGLSLTTDYDWTLTDAWHAHAGGALRWVGRRWGEIGVHSLSLDGAPTMELPAYSVLDLNAAIAKGPLVLRAFLRNLTDTRAKSQGIVLGDPSHPPAEIEERILQPRSSGFGFDYAF